MKFLKKELNSHKKKSRWVQGSKYRQIKVHSRSKPNSVVSMIGEIIAGFRVSKYDQIISIQCQPRQELVKLLNTRSKLARKHRVRTHRFFMHAPHNHTKLVSRRLAKPTGLLDGVCIKINMSVIAGDAGNGVVFGHVRLSKGLEVQDQGAARFAGSRLTGNELIFTLGF